MIPIKKYIAEMFLNKAFRFKCDCIVPFDLIGTVNDYEIVGHEIVLLVSVNGKVIHIGLNTSALQIEPV